MMDILLSEPLFYVYLAYVGAVVLATSLLVTLRAFGVRFVVPVRLS